MTLRIALAMLLLMFSPGCGSSSYTPPAAPTPMPGPATAVSIVTGASTLTTTAYAPNPVNVAVGATVRWMNNDTTTHTSTANGGAWSSGAIAPGGSFSMTFQSAGTYPYRCTIHPNMIGTVTVQ
jgi:plastocyanin